MDYDAAAFQEEAGHPVPPLMHSFLTWQAPYEYGDLGYFELSAEPLANLGGGWPNLACWGAATWGFLRLPEGSIIALCEAVQPPAVVLVGSEGDIKTLAESFEAFLLDWANGDDDGEIVQMMLSGDEPEEHQIAAMKALRSWVKKSKLKAPAVTGTFDFEAYVEGAAAERTLPSPPKKQQSAQQFPAEYLELLEGMGPTLRALCDLLGRTADDADLCALSEQLTSKLPPQSISTKKSDEAVWLSAKKFGVDLLFKADVLSQRYPPAVISKTKLCPYFSALVINADCSEPTLSGLRGEALWEAFTQRFPAASMTIGRLGGPQTTRVRVMLDEVRGVKLELCRSPHGISARAMLSEGRSLCEYDVEDINTGAGLFVQWALEKGWLERVMFTGHEALIDGMLERRTRPSQLAKAALSRGLWDTHLRDEPGLRQFSYVYFHNMDGIWINADLKKMFGKREGKYGHDEPVLDDDSPAIFDKVFAKFSAQFEAWKKAKHN